MAESIRPPEDRIPRSSRWIVAENARLRRTLNRVVVQLVRLEARGEISEEAAESLRAILRQAKQ